MFRITFNALNNVATGVLRQSLQRSQVAVASRTMSQHTETDEEFDARYEAYFNRPDIDGWEIRQAMNDICGMDLIPEPKIIIAAMKACRRVNDYAVAVRFLESIQFKTGPRKDIWDYVLSEIKPAIEELGIDTPDKLGFDKPELALQNVYEIH